MGKAAMVRGIAPRNVCSNLVRTAGGSAGCQIFSPLALPVTTPTPATSATVLLYRPSLAG